MPVGFVAVLGEREPGEQRVSEASRLRAAVGRFRRGSGAAALGRGGLGRGAQGTSAALRAQARRAPAGQMQAKTNAARHAREISELRGAPVKGQVSARQPWRALKRFCVLLMM